MNWVTFWGLLMIVPVSETSIPLEVSNVWCSMMSNCLYVLWMEFRVQAHSDASIVLSPCDHVTMCDGYIIVIGRLENTHSSIGTYIKQKPLDDQSWHFTDQVSYWKYLFCMFCKLKNVQHKQNCLKSYWIDNWNIEFYWVQKILDKNRGHRGPQIYNKCG